MFIIDAIKKILKIGKLNSLMKPNTSINKSFKVIDTDIISKVAEALKKNVDKLYLNYDRLENEYISVFKNIDDGKNYSELICIFENIKAKMVEKNKEQYFYCEEYDEDIALADVLHILSNEKNGFRPITWTMKTKYGNPKTQDFLAYYIDSEDWKLLKMYVEDSKGNHEGYTFDCCIDPDISNIFYPLCDCEEVSDTVKVVGNHISSDCDTWGTSYGVKAKALYAFYITDINKYGVVQSSYYVY